MGDFINSTNDAESLWRLNSKIALELAPTTAIFVLYAIIGITGNSASIFIYRCRMKKIKGKRSFIIVLLSTDLASCVVSSGFAVSTDVFPLTFRGDTLCKLIWIVNSFLTIFSALILLLIAIDGYRLICVPLGRSFNRFWRRLALIATLVTSLILSFPTLVFYGETFLEYPQYNISGTTCGKSNDQKYPVFFFFYNCVLLLTFAVGATTLVVLYSLIGKSILAHSSKKWRKRKHETQFSVDSMETSISEGIVLKVKDISHLKQTKNTKIDDINTDTLPKHEKEGNKSLTSSFHRHRHTLMFMSITLIFLISFAPYITIMILKSIDPFIFDGLSMGQYRTYLFFLRFYILNNIVNPFLYGIFDVEFRNTFCQLLKTKCKQTKPE